jgi:hypothetical protein
MDIETAATGPRVAFRLLTATAIALLAAAAAVWQTSARADPPPLVASVHGIEVNAEHTTGTFSGYATGGLHGGWLAVVDHTPLAANADITGGTLTLVTKTNGAARTLTGQFTGGTITMTNPGANCTNQTFKVTGSLAHFDGNRSGLFTVTLTHWRRTILGTCHSYFATTNGTLTVNS